MGFRVGCLPGSGGVIATRGGGGGGCGFQLNQTCIHVLYMYLPAPAKREKSMEFIRNLEPVPELLNWVQQCQCRCWFRPGAAVR